MAKVNTPFPHVDHVEIEINQKFDQMVFCLNQRRVAVLTAYRNLKQEKAVRLLALARKEEELVGLIADTEHRLQMNDLRQVQGQVLAAIDQKLEEVRTPQPNTRIVFWSQSMLLKQLIAELGQVFEVELFVPNYETMGAVVAVGKMGIGPGELLCPKAVTVDSNNRIFVAEGNASVSHARISVFSERGEFLTSFTPQIIRDPHGLAIYGDYLYMTDTELHAIFKFQMEPQFSLVAKQGKRGSQIGEFNWPCNLAVSTNGDLYVADCKNERVKILNSSLQHPYSLTGQRIHSPRDIKLTDEEVYVLCDDNPCVHVFSHAGHLLHSLVSRGDQFQMTDPFFFCLDAAGNIIISDSWTHRIQIFSNEGDLIRTIGEEGHQPGMLYHPSGLALIDDFSLVVVSYNYTFSFQIFSC